MNLRHFIETDDFTKEEYLEKMQAFSSGTEYDFRKKEQE